MEEMLELRQFRFKRDQSMSCSSDSISPWDDPDFYLIVMLQGVAFFFLLLNKIKSEAWRRANPEVLPPIGLSSLVESRRHSERE